MKFSRAFLHDCLYLPQEEVDAETLQRLTVKSRFDDEVEISEYKAGPEGWIGVPRHFFKNIDEVVGYCQDRSCLGEHRFDFLIRQSFRDGQENIVDGVMEKIRKGGTGFLVVAPTGGGKTFIALNLIQRLARPALVIVPKSDLINQWVEEIQQHTTIHPSSVGIGRDGKIDWRGKSIVVTLADTLCKDREPDGFKELFGTVIIDEVDRRIPASTLNGSLSLMPARYRIAITATPNRRDGLGKLIQDHVAQHTITGMDVRKLSSRVIMHYYYANDPIRLPKGDAARDTVKRKSLFLSQIQEDFGRNRLIARYVVNFLESGRRTLVIADRTPLLINVRNLLVNTFHAKEEDVGYYTASLFNGYAWKTTKAGRRVRARVSKTITPKERARVAAECNVILATYGMMGAGTNIPDLAGLILATPQTTAEQAMGRIERYLEGKRQPITVDVVDDRSADAIRWARLREIEYRRRGLSIKTCRVERN